MAPNFFKTLLLEYNNNSDLCTIGIDSIIKFKFINVFFLDELDIENYIHTAMCQGLISIGHLTNDTINFQKRKIKKIYNIDVKE